MIEEQGRVIELSGDYALVQTQRRASCGTCVAQGACGTALFDRFLGRRPITLRARNEAGAALGDWVIVGVPERVLLGAALAAYLVPILALVLGGALGHWAVQQPLSVVLGAGSNLGAVIGAVSGFLLALSWLRRYSASQARSPMHDPLVLRRFARESPSTPLYGPVPVDWGPGV